MRIKYRIIDLLIDKKTLRNCHNVLSDKNHYYQQLSERNKRIFRIRTVFFEKTTRFSADNGFLLTTDKKYLISSAFVQITFGLKHDILKYFNHIQITPKAYSYKHMDALFVGDVNPNNRRVTLSWPAIEKGFEVSDDGINLCIHEFAHCLIMENAKLSYFSRIFNEDELRFWKTLGHDKLERIKKSQGRLFRSYAGTNLMELFAVSLETFFENPDEFQLLEPVLFNSLCRLLKQDPRKRVNPRLLQQDLNLYRY